MNNAINDIQTQINSIAVYNDENLKQYQQLLKLGMDRLQYLQKEGLTPMSEIWVNMAIDEIKKELETRFNANFSALSPDRQKTEFLYSRSAVSLVLTNVLMHL
ncbi:MAG TPA: hypothetical protein PK252_09975 [Bacteroidales bacterium]|nr:hypothetical protein [Bacteroidales bacterium]